MAGFDGGSEGEETIPNLRDELEELQVTGKCGGGDAVLSCELRVGQFGVLFEEAVPGKRAVNGVAERWSGFF